MILSHSFQSCIQSARKFQKTLLQLFSDRNYASLQLVEALAYAPKPTSVVELSEEAPFQRSYSVINKILNAFGKNSLITKEDTINKATRATQEVDPVAFFKITQPFSRVFFEMLPQNKNRPFRLFALDVTPIPRVSC